MVNLLFLLHGDADRGFMLFGYDLPRMHAVLNDLPAALLVAAVLFELAFLVLKKESFRHAAYWTLMFGVVGAGLAVLSGLGAEDRIAHSEAVHEIMEEHETLAFWTTGIFAVVALWRIVRESKMSVGERIGVLALSLVGTGVLIDTGVHGGKMVFDHGAGISNEVMQEEMKGRAEGHTHGEMEEDEDHDHAPTPTKPDSAK